MLRTSTTGSYPPLSALSTALSSMPPDVREQLTRDSIARAVHDQIELGIDVLVDGQPRDNVVSIFANRLPGFAECRTPACVISRIRPASVPITLADYRFARELAPGRSVKAHVTGPMTLARNCFVAPEAPYQGRTDRRLIEDLAIALGEEALALTEDGAEIVQIDEPVLATGVDLDLAQKSVETVVRVGHIRNASLHACGDVSPIFRHIVERWAVQIISIEASCLNETVELRELDGAYLARYGKTLGIGCIRTNVSQIETLMRVRVLLQNMYDRFGPTGIWAAMPNCGLRTLSREIAQQKLAVMVQAARSVSTAQ